MQKKKKTEGVKYEVITVVNMNIIVFWEVMSCSLLRRYGRIIRKKLD
jgi:hypothetical protein